jgi:cell wall-associated NlpC family hydrolase
MADFRLDPTPKPVPGLPPRPAPVVAAGAAPAAPALELYPAEEVAALQRQGLLPPDFARAGAWDQKSMWRGAHKIQASPWMEPMRQQLQVGDVVLAHGHDFFISPMDGNAEYIHAAIVSNTNPLTLVEAWGPNDSGNAAVREASFAAFVAGTGADGYKVLRPTTDPTKAQAAVAFARSQVGKPYNWSFNLFGPTGDASWFCSNLVHAAYQSAGAPLGVKKDPQRDRILATVRDVARALRIQDPAKVTQLITMAYSSPLLGSQKHSLNELMTYAANEVLAPDPVFKPLMQTPAGHQLVMGASLELVQGFTSGKPVDFKHALWDRFRALGWRDQLTVGWATLRGLIHLHVVDLWHVRRDLKQGDIVSEMISPQDLAEGPASTSWTYGAAR